MSGSSSLSCWCKQYALCWAHAFLLGVWLWVPDGQRVPHGQSSRESPVSRVCFPGGQEFTRFVTTHSWAEYRVFRVAPPGRGTLEATLQLVSQTSPTHLFLCWPCLGSVSVINHIHEYECGWSPSVLLRIPEPGVALGTPGSALHHLVHYTRLITRHAAPQLSSWLTNTCCSLCLEGPLLATTWPVSSPLEQGSFPVSPIRKAMLDHPRQNCKTAPPFSVPSSCFILVNTYHLIHFLSTSFSTCCPPPVALTRMKPQVSQQSFISFLISEQTAQKDAFGRNDKISEVCFKAFNRTKNKLSVSERAGRLTW